MVRVARRVGIALGSFVIAARDLACGSVAVRLRQLPRLGDRHGRRCWCLPRDPAARPARRLAQLASGRPLAAAYFRPRQSDGQVRHGGQLGPTGPGDPPGCHPSSRMGSTRCIRPSSGFGVDERRSDCPAVREQGENDKRGTLALGGISHGGNSLARLTINLAIRLSGVRAKPRRGRMSRRAARTDRTYGHRVDGHPRPASRRARARRGKGLSDLVPQKYRDGP